MFNSQMTVAGFDPELAKAIADERNRQEDHIELIASENYASPRVLEAQGSVLTNKYAEGYPGKRYYGGCEFVDVAEQLAIDRAKRLFGADYANVQPHSGSQANAAVYLAMLNPGDTILGMSLDHGGHLTHGAKVNFSGKLFNAVQYGIKSDSGEIDYDQVQGLAKQHRPKVVVAGFSAYSRVIDWSRFRAIADSVGAYFFVDMAHVAGDFDAPEIEPRALRQLQRQRSPRQQRCSGQQRRGGPAHRLAAHAPTSSLASARIRSTRSAKSIPRARAAIGTSEWPVIPGEVFSSSSKGCSPSG